MPEPALISELRSRNEDDASIITRHFQRLQALTETRFERPLRPEELQELLALRNELRDRLAGWLQKR
jgi:hypothetical protein